MLESAPPAGHRWHRLRRFAPVFALLIAPALSAQPQAVDSIDAESRVADAAVPVRFRGRVLFEVAAPIGELSPGQRAAAIESRLLAITRSPTFDPADVRIIERRGSTELVVGDALVRVVSDADAAGTGRTRRQLAADHGVQVRNALAGELAARSTAALLRGALLAVLATVLFAAAIAGLRRIMRWIRARITRKARDWRSDGRQVRRALLTGASIARTARSAATFVGWLVGLGLFYAYLQFTMSLFPWTRGIAEAMLDAVTSAFSRTGTALVDYLPSLLNIVVIVVIARLALKMLRTVFLQVAEERIDVTGFYPEWAMPTYSLLRFLVVAISAVMVFPYLPGSGSEGFRGVSVFLGLLLSLGAASAIANVIAGVVVTYMRPFRVGDRVRIADAVGDVTGKDLFVVRLRTVKNVDITIPNALVLANHIVNFSSSADSRGLVLHTTVTIGYDVPWRTVHELLVQAARRVEGILGNPAPFVLQTSLGDFAVSYELNAFTADPHQMAVIYSRLHEEIQNAFNAAGVEIMSPHFTAVRDGNRTAIPDAYLPKNYRAPAFSIGLSRPTILRPDGPPAAEPPPRPA